MYILQCDTVHIIRRTTIEIDEELLQRAKRALGCATTRATIEEALRRVVEQAESVVHVDGVYDRIAEVCPLVVRRLG